MTDFLLQHPATTNFNESGILSNVESVDDFIKQVRKYSEGKGRTKEETDKIKGDFLEVFGEFLIKSNPYDERIGVQEYQPNLEKDLGVDGFGKGFDGTVATIQFKFRSNPTEPLTYRDLSTFLADSKFQFKVTNDKNVLVVSTVYDLYYTVSEVAPDTRHLGLEQLQHLTKQRPHFWESFREVVEASAKKPIARPQLTLMDHQREALEKIEEAFLNGKTRGQIQLPTGTGKTHVAHMVADKELEDKFNGLAIFASSRISLVKQGLHDFWNHKQSNWKPMVICSGSDEELEYREGDSEHTRIRTTTDPRKIIEELQLSRDFGENVVLFITYHSLKKVGRILKSEGIVANLTIGDEAHNLTASAFHKVLNNKVLPSEKWLFFTATRRIGCSKSGRGMDNLEKFGEIFYTAPPSVMIRRGVIVPPKIHLAISPEKDSYLEEALSDSQSLAFVVAMSKEHVKYSTSGARIIVFCEGADQAHSLANNPTLKEYLPDFKSTLASFRRS